MYRLKYCLLEDNLNMNKQSFKLYEGFIWREYRIIHGNEIFIQYFPVYTEHQLQFDRKIAFMHFFNVKSFYYKFDRSRTVHFIPETKFCYLSHQDQTEMTFCPLKWYFTYLNNLYSLTDSDLVRVYLASIPTADVV